MDVESIYRSHGEGLFRYLARHCGDPQTARDAVQETFVRLQERPPAHEGAVRSWLFRTGLNVVRDIHRVDANRARILEEHSRQLPGPSSPRSPEERLEHLEDVARLRAALAGLRDKERTALLLRESGFKHREIADELGTTTATVGTLIARSLAKLEEAMREGEAP